MAHGHLTSKNVFVNLSDMKIQIGDFGMTSLKKFCKLFNNYEMLNNCSAPEVWEKHFNGPTSNEYREKKSKDKNAGDVSFNSESMKNTK